MLLDALFRNEPLENPSTPITGESAETDNIFARDVFVSPETAMKLAAVYACIYAQSGVGNGPDLHPHGAGICLSVRRRGLVQPEGLVMAVVDHDGSSLLHRGGGGGTCPSWQAGNLQYRPGIAVHLHRLHRRAEEVTDCHLDGWQGCVARQCLRRAALAFDQIRGSLPPCLQDCVRGTRWHRPISELLQHQTPTLALLQS